MSATPMQYLPVLLTLILFVVAVVLIGRRRKAAPVLTFGPKPAGFQGWLALLGVAQALTPLQLARTSLDSLSALGLPSLSESIDRSREVDAGCLTALTLFTGVVAVSMWRRSCHFRVLFTWQWALLMTFVVLQPAVITLLADEGLPLADAYGTLALLAIGRTALGGLWVAYVWRSVRVRNTFIRGRGKAAEPLVDPETFA